MSARAWIACALLACALLPWASACGDDDALVQLRAARAEEGVRNVVTELWRDPGAVYDGASPRLRRARPRMSFIGQAQDLAAVMGAFEGEVRVTSIDVAHGVGGRTARISAQLGFELDTMEAWVSFEEYEGGWRLLGVELPVSPALEVAWDEAVEARGAASAPDEVVEAAFALIAALSTPTSSGARGASESAAAEAKRAIAAYGPFVKPVRASWSRIDAAQSRVRIAAILEYEHGWTRAELVLVAADGDGAPWVLETLRVVDPNRLDDEVSAAGDANAAPDVNEL
jgi:hypothetical protein